MEPREQTPEKPENAPQRSPYKAPRLRKLGSVRDLTLGSPLVAVADGKGGKRFGM